MRSSLKAARRSEANEADVIFSYIDGYVWMSWAGAVATVRVGQYQAATAGMRDFLAQSELANGWPMEKSNHLASKLVGSGESPMGR